MSDYGVFSLLPPLVAMVLALATQNVILSLGIGVFSGFVLGAGGDLIIGLYASLEQGIFGQLASQAHASLVVLVLIIGGFVGLLEATGGLATFARRIASWVRGPVGAQLAVWVAGIGIFFSDSATPLILGPIFRPVLQKSGVSREKLAYILDSTASPVCVLVPFISWGIYTMSLFGQAHRQLGVTTDAFTTFMEVMPLQLYPILALVTVPLTILARRELGPMASAARSLGAYEADVLDRSGEALDAPKDPPLAGADGEAGARQAPLGVVVFPLIVLGATVAGLFLRVYLIQGKLGGPALTTSLTLAYLAATVVAVGLARRASLLSLKEGLGAFRRGVERMLIVPLILLLAWSLSHVCGDLGTGRYVARLTAPILTPGLLSPALFVISAVISFAMGSAWGTFAILMPLAASLAHGMHIDLVPPFAAVLSGGLFGDHASPISDTTILASMGAGCRHIDHVRTQLPYALIAATVSLFGFYGAGRGMSARWVLPLSIVALIVLLGIVMWRWGQPLELPEDI